MGVRGGMKVVGWKGWGAGRRGGWGVRVLGSVDMGSAVGVMAVGRAGVGLLVVGPGDKSRKLDVGLDSPYDCEGRNRERKLGSAVARRLFDWSVGVLVV